MRILEEEEETEEEKRLRHKQQQLKRILAQSNQGGSRNIAPARRRHSHSRWENNKEVARDHHGENNQRCNVGQITSKDNLKKQPPITGRMILVFVIGVVIGALIGQPFVLCIIDYLFSAFFLLADIVTILLFRLFWSKPCTSTLFNEGILPFLKFLLINSFSPIYFSILQNNCGCTPCRENRLVTSPSVVG